MSSKKYRVKYISSSYAKTYLKCKSQFFRSIIRDGHDQYSDKDTSGLEEEKDFQICDRVELDFGSAVHKAIETFWKNEKKTRVSLTSLYRENYIRYGVNDRGYYELGNEICDMYFDYLIEEAPKRKLVATEFHFDYLLEGEGHYLDMSIKDLWSLCKEHGVKYEKQDSKQAIIEKLKDANALPRSKGTIDGIFYLGNGIYELVDYKTSNWLPSQDEIDTDVQLRTYDLAFFKDPSFESIWYKGIEPKSLILTLHFLRYGSKGVMQTEVDEEQREINRNFFIDTFHQYNTLDDKYFFETINRFCPWCEYHDECESYQNVLDEDAEAFAKTLDPETIEEMIEAKELIGAKLSILKREADSISNNLTEMFRRSKSKSVIVEGEECSIEYYMENYTKRYLLPRLTIKILQDHDLFDPNQFLDSIPLGKIENWLSDEHPDVWEEIERKCIRRYVGNPSLRTRKIRK